MATTTNDTADAQPTEEIAIQFIGSGSPDMFRKAITVRAMGKRLPGLIAKSIRLAWSVDRRATLTLLAAQFASALLEAFGLLATTATITQLVGSGDIGHRVTEALPSIAAIAAAAGLRAVLGITINSTSQSLSPRIARRAEVMLIEAGTSAELVAYDTPDFNDSWDAADRGADVAADLVIEAQSVLSSLSSLIAAACVLTVMHPVLLPLLLIAVLPQGIAAIASTRSHYLGVLESRTDRRALNLLRWHLVDKTHAGEVRASTMTKFLMGRYHVHGERVDQRMAKSIRHNIRMSLVGSLLGGAGSAVVWGAVIALLATGHMSVAASGTAVLALRTATGSLHGIVRWSSNLFRTGLYLDDWSQFLGKAGGYRIERGTATPPPPTVFTVDDVSFAYPGSTKNAVDGVSFTVARGQVVAIVGENGSGKSTLSNLLCGLYLPTGGTVKWDDHPTGDIDPHHLWQQCSFVHQGYARWPLTCRDNIALGSMHPHGDDAIHRSAKAVGADTVIGELRSGLDTLLAKEFWGGQDLSGGQWQRIALARAVHREAALLVFDEPTSALDPRAEHLIFTGLREFAADRAVVLITHRLVNVTLADHIVVLDKGRVVQQGTFTELVAQPGLFQELWVMQNERGHNREG